MMKYRCYVPVASRMARINEMEFSLYDNSIHYGPVEQTDLCGVVAHWYIWRLSSEESRVRIPLYKPRRDLASFTHSCLWRIRHSIHDVSYVSLSSTGLEVEIA